MKASVAFQLKLKCEFHLGDAVRDWKRMDAVLVVTTNELRRCNLRGARCLIWIMPARIARACGPL
jgi:hypothetical protein